MTTWIEARADTWTDYWVRVRRCAGTRDEAQAFCVNLSLPSALIPPDATRTCRLPTPNEWECAAKAWSGQRSGAYITWMQQHYKVPGLDDRITPDQIRTYREGYARIAELPPNEIGLCGLLGHAREWCAAAPGPQGDGAGQYLHWDEYFTNYDNAIGYQTRSHPAEAGQGLAFRLACSVVAL